MLQKCTIFRVAKVFFDQPSKKFGLVEISRKAGLAHTSVTNQLDNLLKLGIIRVYVEKKGRRKFPQYYANSEEIAFKRYKKIHNLDMLHSSGIVEFIKDTFMPRSVVLFGTYSRGEDKEDSDIDIFIESEGKEVDLSNFEKKLNRKVELHFKKRFAEYPKELKNNILNGITISGFLEGYV